MFNGVWRSGYVPPFLCTLAFRGIDGTTRRCCVIRARGEPGREAHPPQYTRSDRGIPSSAIRFSTAHLIAASTFWFLTVRAERLTPSIALYRETRILRHALASAATRLPPLITALRPNTPEMGITHRTPRRRMRVSAASCIASRQDRRDSVVLEHGLVAGTRVVGPVCGDLPDRTRSLRQQRREPSGVVDVARSQVHRNDLFRRLIDA